MEKGDSTVIAGYRILQELGRGGMATVYRAVQESLGREVALKVMSPELARDPAYVERFLREGKVVARLRHRNIVTVHDLGLTSSGSPYLAMEYVPGGSVAARIGSLDTAAAVRCVREIASALDHAHRNGVVHRDIKPENILCHEDGSFLLSDFGVARLSEATSSLTAEGSTLGTPQYMSPEQWRGEQLDGRTDLYALGVVFYQLLTGSAPYSGTDGWAIGMQHMSAEIPRLPPAKSAFQPLLDRMLAKQRDQRPATGQVVAQEIDELLSRLGPLPPGPAVAPPPGLTTPHPAAGAIKPPAIPSPPAAPPAAPAPQAPPAPPAPPSPESATRASAAKPSRTPLYLGIAAFFLIILSGLGWGAYHLLSKLAQVASDSTDETPSTSTAAQTPAAVGSAGLAANATSTTRHPDTNSTDDSTGNSADSDGAAKVDSVVRAQLDTLGIKYEIDQDGDFKIVQSTGDGRTQQSWVRSHVSDYGTLHIREIMSIGYRTEDAELPAEIARQLLRDTHENKLGAWTRQGGTAVYVVKIPADVDAEQLKYALDATQKITDAMEKQLSGDKDEF